LVVGCWVLAFGYWVLGIGCWILAVGYWLLAIGFWKGPLQCIQAAAKHFDLCKVTKAGGIFQEKPVRGGVLLWRDKQTVHWIDPVNTVGGLKNKSPGSLFDSYTRLLNKHISIKIHE
jgi:hypothetical protein